MPSHSSAPDNCIIWPSSPAEHHSVQGNLTTKRVTFSARTGTGYIISRDVALYLFNELNTAKLRAQLTTQLLNANLRGTPEPEVTYDMIQLAKNAQPLPANERADRLLRHIVDKNPDIAIPATLVRQLDHHESPHLSSTYSAMAWSESTTLREVEFLLEYLSELNYVNHETILRSRHATVTVQGHSHVASRLTSTNSSQAFVAMWFNDSMDAVYNHAFAPAIQAAGYEPYRIDRDNFLNKIDDEIIAQIRQSRFLLADFTHEPEGSVRGSVYFEAGFAHGLGIPVIFTAHEDADLHFDTRQFPHILWKPTDLNALKQELTNRLLALSELGRGPHAPPHP